MPKANARGCVKGYVWKGSIVSCRALSIASPRVETPTHYILMGIDVDLNRAMRLAVQQVVDFLTTEKHMAPAAALALASVGCDFHVAEAVDLTQVVVGRIPKSVFVPAPKR